jgi:hypothetical protein
MTKSLFWLFIASLFISLSGCAGGDRDSDGIPNKLDECPDDAEDFDNFEDTDGCPDVDNDKDGVCDPWVAEMGLSAKYAKVCVSSDKCPLIPEDRDGFEDTDGCPDPDNDGDGITDKFDKCPNEPEDVDGFEDKDGCPDPDNDGDGICDPWVAEQGLGQKYASICKGSDKCPSQPEDIDGFEDEDGCPDTDNDGDGIPDKLDKCPNEKGLPEKEGCPLGDELRLPPTTLLDLRFETGTPNLTYEDKVKIEQKLVPGLKTFPTDKVYVFVFVPKIEIPIETYLELLNARTRSIYEHLVSLGIQPDQIKTRTITEEIFNASVGTENDFNSDKPVLFKRN